MAYAGVVLAPRTSRVSHGGSFGSTLRQSAYQPTMSVGTSHAGGGAPGETPSTLANQGRCVTSWLSTQPQAIGTTVRSMDRTKSFAH